MKMKVMSLLFFLVVYQPLFSQNRDSSIEDVYLQSSVAIQIIRAEARSSDRHIKLTALEDIEKIIDSEGLAGNEEIIDILRDLSSEGISHVVMSSGNVINAFPEVRREAARVLGKVKDPRTLPILNNVIYRDNETMVIKEAVNSISKWDMDDEQQKIRNRVMADMMRRQTNLSKDNSLAMTFLEAVLTIIEREKEMNDPALFEEIIKIANARSGYKRAVRLKAWEILKDLQEI